MSFHYLAFPLTVVLIGRSHSTRLLLFKLPLAKITGTKQVKPFYLEGEMLSRTYCAPFPYICTIRKKYCSLQEHLATLAVSRRWVLRAAASQKMRGIGWRQYYIFNTICRAYLNYSRLHLQTVQVVFNFNSRLCPVGCRQMRATLLGMEYEQDITGLASLVLFILAG